VDQIYGGRGEDDWQPEGEEPTARRPRNGLPSMVRALPLSKRISCACNDNPEDLAGFESTFQKQPESYSARSKPPTVTFCPLQ